MFVSRRLRTGLQIVHRSPGSNLPVGQHGRIFEQVLWNLLTVLLSYGFRLELSEIRTALVKLLKPPRMNSVVCLVDPTTLSNSQGVFQNGTNVRVDFISENQPKHDTFVMLIFSKYPKRIHPSAKMYPMSNSWEKVLFGKSTKMCWKWSDKYLEKGYRNKITSN